MKSFLEPKPKYGVTPFFKSNYFVPVFLIYPYDFKTAVKNRCTVENHRWHFRPSQLLTSFVFTYLQKNSCGASILNPAGHYLSLT